MQCSVKKNTHNTMPRAPLPRFGSAQSLCAWSSALPRASINVSLWLKLELTANQSKRETLGESSNRRIRKIISKYRNHIFCPKLGFLEPSSVSQLFTISSQSLWSLEHNRLPIPILGLFILGNSTVTPAQSHQTLSFLFGHGKSPRLAINSVGYRFIRILVVFYPWPHTSNQLSHQLTTSSGHQPELPIQILSILSEDQFVLACHFPQIVDGPESNPKGSSRAWSQMNRISRLITLHLLQTDGHQVQTCERPDLSAYQTH